VTIFLMERLLLKKLLLADLSFLLSAQLLSQLELLYSTVSNICDTAWLEPCGGHGSVGATVGDLDGSAVVVAGDQYWPT